MIELDTWYQINSRSSILINEAKSNGYKYLKIKDKDTRSEMLVVLDSLQVSPNVIKGHYIHYETGSRYFRPFPFSLIDSISFCNSEYKTGYIVDKKKMQSTLEKAIHNEDYIEIETFDRRNEQRCINRLVVFCYYDNNGNKYSVKTSTLYIKIGNNFNLYLPTSEIISLRVRQERHYNKVEDFSIVVYSQDEIEGDNFQKYNNLEANINLTERYLKTDISNSLSSYNYSDTYKYIGILVKELKAMPDSLKRRKLIIHLLEESKVLETKNKEFKPICFIRNLNNIDPFLTKVYSENGLKFLEAANYSKNRIKELLNFNQKYNS